jgi:hypothetical protein
MAVCRLDLSQSLRLDDWRLVTGQILQNIEANIGGQIERSLPAIVKAWAERGRLKPFSRDLSIMPHIGVYNAIDILIHSSDLDAVGADRLNRFLLGERIGAGALRRGGVRGVKNPLSKRNAELFLKTVSGAVYSMGLTGTMLLFDESEQVYRTAQSYPSRAVIRSANIMRRFIDACANGSLVGTVAVFAVLPQFVDRCSEAYDALGQRLRPPALTGLRPSWRWPVVGVEHISRTSDEDQFLKEAVVLLVKWMERLTGKIPGEVKQLLQKEGEDVLANHVGLSFRRPLMKRLAATVMDYIDLRR